MIKGTKEMAQQLRALLALPKDLHLGSYPHWSGSTTASNSSSRFLHLSHPYRYSHACAHTHKHTDTQAHRHTQLKEKSMIKVFQSFQILAAWSPTTEMCKPREDVRDWVRTWHRGQAQAHALLSWDCFLYFAFLLLLVCSKNVLNVL